MEISERQLEIQKKAFVLKIMASELVASKFSYCDHKRVLDSQRVNIQSNILDLTKADFFQLNLTQIHGKIG